MTSAIKNLLLRYTAAQQSNLAQDAKVRAASVVASGNASHIQSLTEIIDLAIANNFYGDWKAAREALSCALSTPRTPSNTVSSAKAVLSLTMSQCGFPALSI